MRALLIASVLLTAAPAWAENGGAAGAKTSGNGAPAATTSNPVADPTARSYVNPQTTQAPKNDDNHNPNYQTPAGSQSSRPSKEAPENASGADGAAPKTR